MFSKLRSIARLAQINISRVVDHTHRNISGYPVLKNAAITPNLFLGGQYWKRGMSHLKQYGITAIVNMRIHSIHPKDFKEFSYLHLPTPDRTAPKLDDLEKGARFIKTQIDNGGKVYVHCRWGEGRGPTMVLAYLIFTGLKLEDAIAVVKSVRPFIFPTKLQLDRLEEFEKNLPSA